MSDQIDRPQNVEHEGHYAQDTEVPRQWKVWLPLAEHLARRAWWILRDAKGVIGRAKWVAAGWEVGSWPGAGGVGRPLPGHGGAMMYC